MADSDPLSQVFNLFAAPLAGTIQSFDQFRKGVDEFLRGVENFNRTMENLNETTERINRLVADVEEPIRAVLPQVTRTVKSADDMMQKVSGPAIAAAPALERLAKLASAPAFAQLPEQIGQFSDVLGDLQARLGPLTQLAESAGGLFGGLRLPGMTGPKPTSPPAPPTAVAEPVTPASQPESPESVKQTAPKTTAVKKKAAARKQSPTKNTAAKKTAASKTAAKKTATRKKTAAKK